VLDKRVQAYLDYVKRLAEQGFTGKVTINLSKGGVTNINKVYEPPVVVEESVKLR